MSSSIFVLSIVFFKLIWVYPIQNPSKPKKKKKNACFLLVLSNFGQFQETVSIHVTHTFADAFVKKETISFITPLHYKAKIIFPYN